jgi:hypothetical protein
VIHIRRPKTEPSALKKQRHAGLQRAFAALNTHGPGSQELADTLVRYDGGKERLFRAQHRKCAFCERRVGFVASPVDHLRPKKATWRHMPGTSPRVVDIGYWWLTWTWENQVFACTSCNTGYKQSYFPLAPGSAVLTGPARPYRNRRLRPCHLDVSVEAPMLVDPSAEDPLDHIEWRPVDRTQPKRLWKWFPADLTPRGNVTIKVLRLEDLADDVGDHVRDNLLAHTESVCAHVDAGQHATAAAEWRTLVRDVAGSRCQLAGPTWNALHYLVDQNRRKVANLPIPPRP